MRHRLIGSISLALMLAACGPGQVAGQGGPSWTSAEDNIAYAVSAICAPYVLDQADVAALPSNQHLVRDDGWKEITFEHLNARPVRVGFAGFVHAAVGTIDGHRQCEITSRNADPRALRNAALAALAKRPEGFAPEKSRYYPGRFASEDNLCASGRSRHPGGFVLISAAHPEEQARTAVLLTMDDTSTRMAECDQPGVPRNYRTLIEPQ